MKLRFFLKLSPTEVHCLRPIDHVEIGPRVGVKPLSAVTGGLEVELSVQRYVHSRLKRGGVDPKNFRPGNPSTETLHKNGHQNCLWQWVKLHSSNQSSQLLDKVRQFLLALTSRQEA